MASNDCFISYRRATSAFVARAVFQDLREHQIDAFLDVEAIDQGAFRDIINAQIRARPYFLPILSPGALDRCKEPNDMLRAEFELALSGKRLIVPLMTTDFDREEIVTSLPAALATRFLAINNVKVDHEYFVASMEKLRRRFLKPVELTGPRVDPALARGAEFLLTRPVPATDVTALRAGMHFERAFAFSANNPTLASAEFDAGSKLLQQAAEPKSLMQDFDLTYLELQASIQRKNAEFALVSSVLKASHDSVKTLISNIR